MALTLLSLFSNISAAVCLLTGDDYIGSIIQIILTFHSPIAIMQMIVEKNPMTRQRQSVGAWNFKLK